MRYYYYGGSASEAGEAESGMKEHKLRKKRNSRVPSQSCRLQVQAQAGRQAEGDL